MLGRFVEDLTALQRAIRWGDGEALFEAVFARAREAGCTLVQLTTDRSRADALRFYERLGFEATHWGMKRDL